jgi:transposase
MTELNVVKCEKCGQKQERGILITKIYGMWICGKCLNAHFTKLNENKKRLLLEE